MSKHTSHFMILVLNPLTKSFTNCGFVRLRHSHVGSGSNLGHVSNLLKSPKKNGKNTLDGSEIRLSTTWDVNKWDKLPTSTGDVFHQQYISQGIAIWIKSVSCFQAWRIIPGRTDTWLITMVIVSPLSRVVGPLPNGLFMPYKWELLTIY